MSLFERRPKVSDVAARAGVSTATVDRIMNRRGGVHQRTVERVEQIIREIMTPDAAEIAMNAAAKRVGVVLARDGSLVTQTLAQALIETGPAACLEVGVELFEPMNPSALADCLRNCARQECKSVVVQALDHSLVREAIAELVAAGISVITVLTDLIGVDRLAYAGLDNRAAGRTAGQLMSRLAKGAGKLAVVWGGQLYRSHEERESGFRSVVRSERNDLECLEVVTGNDDFTITRERVEKVIAQHPDLVGIYCVGGGVVGAAQAIDNAGLGASLVMIGHNCNAQTRPYLVSGTIDAVVHQDIKLIAQHVIKCLSSEKAVPSTALVPIEIIMRENMLHR